MSGAGWEEIRRQMPLICRRDWLKTDSDKRICLAVHASIQGNADPGAQNALSDKGGTGQTATSSHIGIVRLLLLGAFGPDKAAGER
jgi:hypothetical protein